MKQILWLAGASALVLSACSKPKDPPKTSTEEATAPKVEEKPKGHAMDEMNFPSIGEMPVPKENPQSKEKIALGHRLFFEKKLSVDGSVSCYSCHQNEDGNGGHTPTAVGAKEKKLSRHSPVIWNVGHLPALYWDGRASSLEGQAKGAWGGGNMGVGKENLDKKAQEVAGLPEYKEAFAAAFPEQDITADHVAPRVQGHRVRQVRGRRQESPHR